MGGTNINCPLLKSSCYALPQSVQNADQDRFITFSACSLAMKTKQRKKLLIVPKTLCALFESYDWKGSGSI